MSTLFPNQVIVSAHLTEKASLVGQFANTYVFKVAGKATKLEIKKAVENKFNVTVTCLLYTSPSPRDATLSRMPSSA